MKNRFAMAPMTRRFALGGRPGPDVGQYYGRRAAGGVALIISEGVYVDHPSAGMRETVPLMDAGSVPAWSAVADALHAAGSALFVQLWHIGSARIAGEGIHPEARTLSPSGLTVDSLPSGQAMTARDIEETIAAYARSAAWARAAGADGIELHGAHGYLIDQFLWGQTNRRTDRFGLSAGDRSAFAVDIIKAIRREVGPDFPISFRFSQWKGKHYDARLAETPQDLARIFEPIVAAGVTHMHASTRRYWLPGFDGSELTLAGWTRKLFGRPTIAVGTFGLDRPYVVGTHAEAASLEEDLARVETLLDRGEFDILAIGRRLIGDAELVAKMQEGRFADVAAFTPETLETLF